MMASRIKTRLTFTLARIYLEDRPETGSASAARGRILATTAEGSLCVASPPPPGYWASGATVNNNHTFNNTGAGIHLLNASFASFTNNTSHGNGSSGIFLDHTSTYPLANHDNQVVGGAYYQNGAAGISESMGSGENTWSQISTYDNMGLGIDKDDNGAPGATGGL
jgi:hypothetical protein